MVFSVVGEKALCFPLILGECVCVCVGGGGGVNGGCKATHSIPSVLTMTVQGKSKLSAPSISLDFPWIQKIFFFPCQMYRFAIYNFKALTFH